MTEAKDLFASRVKELTDDLKNPLKAPKYLGWKREYARDLRNISEGLEEAACTLIMKLMDQCPAK